MKTVLLLALFIAQNAVNTTTIPGRISVDDGSALPTVNTFRGPNVQVGLKAFLPGTASQVATATMSADGSFVLPLTVAAGTGEFAIAVTMIPLGYHVKSITYGSVDLVQSRLTITPASGSAPLQIVLSKTPPAGVSAGVRVSGRVRIPTGAAASLTLSLQSTQTGSNGVSVLHIGNVNLGPDGSFEFRGVPAGRYRGFTPSDSGNSLIDFEVADRDVSGLEITLASPASPSIIITSGPFGPAGIAVRASPFLVAPPATRPQPPPGSAIVAISQSGNPPKWYEGALHFFRVAQAGVPLEEKRTEGSGPTFTLTPGTYELLSYSRGCDGNCGNIGSPEVLCVAPFTVTANQVLYAERIVQGPTCTIRFSAPAVR